MNNIAQAERTNKRPGHVELTYDTTIIWSTIFRRFGSVWPDVFPFCIMNVILTFTIDKLMKECKIDMTFNSDTGHAFLSTLVSFLIVSRIRIAQDGLMVDAGYVQNLFQNSRELVMNAISFSRKNNSSGAMEWRQEICRRVIVILRVTIAVLEYGERREDVSQISILKAHEQEALETVAGAAIERYPIILSLLLRTAISSHDDFGLELLVNERRNLYDINEKYLSNYSHLLGLICTPFPFPLVQMCRTLLFLWIFTLPFALLNETGLIYSCIIMFFLTFGFVGLEFVAMKLDNPFGSDDNNLDIYEMSKVCLVVVTFFICPLINLFHIFLAII
mmetsp:Transcript_9666/g.21477  ORF Transcript_9666/g.21477 Transcript_9666/m.21477 type:complete len:333 (+) Transcript_9666:168-1166(+)